MQNRRPAEFIALIALLTAMVAMSIDTMLPAMGAMARELGAADPNYEQFIIFGFFGGMLFGNLVFGPLSDSTGRKPAIFAGLVFYIAGACICAFAASFPMLIAGRMLQGFGAASPRVVSMSMVRDGVAGAAMARTMSFVMSVFMLVPILAPTVGTGVLLIASWRWIFVGFIAAAILAAAWLALRQSETLAPDKRLPFTATALFRSAREVASHPVSLGYTVAVGAIFGAFTNYLGTSRQIFVEQYDQGQYFALWFGGLAVGIAIAMIVNGRLVMQLGMRKLSKWAVRGFILVWAIMLPITLMTSGHPPLLVLGLAFLVSFFFSGMMFGNYNAMAMEPMGHIAGMASAFTSFLSSLVAVILGMIAGYFYNGTLTPLTVAFLSYGILALIFSEWAERGRARQ
jgi:MFS transporter, DHA1 family, multidrug resistance protein